jgi:hypothetical protein
MQPSDHETFHGNDQLDFEKINFAWKTRHLEKAPLIYWVSNPPPPGGGLLLINKGRNHGARGRPYPITRPPNFLFFFLTIFIYIGPSFMLSSHEKFLFHP